MVDFDNLEDSIAEVYQHYYLDVYRFLVCFSGNQNDAEDLTQEVFIRVLNQLSMFRKGKNMKTWILSIAKHVAVDHYRRKKFISIFKEGFFLQLASKEKAPDELFEMKELKDHVNEAISRLKPNFRAVIILRAINEYSIKETAEILQCSESKIKVTYHRALKELQKKIHLYAEEVIRNAN
ncbi:RNA polymerase sigma factor [Bacillus spongiae]|uniref:RNA polymerase sigma factor n=1 Tax=Bacillus spongiae TaxID=2683610 RepID=A0ABU8HC40_9BACI